MQGANVGSVHDSFSGLPTLMSDTAVVLQDPGMEFGTSKCPAHIIARAAFTPQAYGSKNLSGLDQVRLGEAPSTAHSYTAFKCVRSSFCLLNTSILYIWCVLGTDY